MDNTVEKIETPKWVWLALATVLLLGAGLRLWQLGERSLWYDEAASIRIGQWFNADWDIFDPTINSEAPMIGIQAKLWVDALEAVGFTDKTSQTRDFMIRLLPATWSMLGVLLIFMLGRELFRRNEPALIAALFLAVSPLHLVYAQELRVYSFYVFASLLAMLFMHRALFRGHWTDWCGMSLTFSLLIYCHFIAVWTVFAFNLAFLWYLWLHRKNLLPWFAANAVMMVLILPSLRIAWYANGRLSEIEYAWFPSPTVKIGLLTIKSFFAGFGPTVWAYWPLFLLAIVLFPLGAAVLYFQNRRFASGFLLIVGLFPVAFNNIFWRLHEFSFYEHRTYIVSGTALLLLFAYGVYALPLRQARYAVVAAVLLFSAPLLRDYYADRLHPVEEHRLAVFQKVDYRSVTELLEERWEDGDLLGYVGHFNAFSMPYYFSGAQCPIATEELYIEVAYKTLGQHNLRVFPEHKPLLLQPLLEEHGRLWFLRSHGITFEWQPNSEAIQEWLEKNLQKKETHEFDGLTLTLFAK